MFKISLRTDGYRWECDLNGCTDQGTLTSLQEMGEAMAYHRDTKHGGYLWSQRVAEAAAELEASPDGLAGFLTTGAQMKALADDPYMLVVGAVRTALQSGAVPAAPPAWEMNHSIRWQVGDRINHPPEGRGCQAWGARVGEDREVCALPRHDVNATLPHVFAIGGTVTRISQNA